MANGFLESGKGSIRVHQVIKYVHVEGKEVE